MRYFKDLINMDKINICNDWNDIDKINSIIKNNVFKPSNIEIVNTFDILKNVDLYIWELNEFLLSKSRNFDFTTWIYSKKQRANIDLDFRKLSSPRKKITSLEIKDISDDVLWEESFLKDPLPIISSDVETFFVISGIQNMYAADSSIKKEQLVHQPSIRMNFDWSKTWAISGVDWIATSFVNSTLYQTDANIKSYIKNIDLFFDFLSKIWIYIWDISLKILPTFETRNWKELFKLVTHIFYWNLHVWDAWICVINQELNIDNSFIDLWFWLERLSLARNKFDNYFHQYLNKKVELDRYSDLEIDTIKTLCLIHSENINDLDKHSWPWFRYKKLLKNLTKDKNYYPIINIFYDYRSNFISFDKTESEILNNILYDLEIH